MVFFDVRDVCVVISIEANKDIGNEKHIYISPVYLFKF